MSVVRASYESYYLPPPYPWPTQFTTGYVHAPGYPGSLANGSALTIASNTTYSFYNFPVGAVVGAGVNNVTFYGCQFLDSGGIGNSAVDMSNGSNGITFNYCTFAPIGVTEPGPAGGVTLAQSYQFGIFAGTTTGLVVKNCDLWGFGNAIYADGSTQASPHIFDWNYIHDCCQDAILHSDGIGLPGGGVASYVQITRNNIQAAGNTNGLAYQVVVSGGGSASYNNFTITGNLFGGWGYAIQLLNGTITTPTAPSNTTFTGNTFSTYLNCQAGPLYDNSFISQPHWLWRNNRWLVPPGSYWGHSQYSGYYWLPGFTSNAGPALDEVAAGLAGTSDYTG